MQNLWDTSDIPQWQRLQFWTLSYADAISIRNGQNIERAIQTYYIQWLEIAMIYTTEILVNYICRVVFKHWERVTHSQVWHLEQWLNIKRWQVIEESNMYTNSAKHFPYHKIQTYVIKNCNQQTNKPSWWHIKEKESLCVFKDYKYIKGPIK